MVFLEGRGSLHFYLKARGWATYLAAGGGGGCIYQTSVAYIFNMTIRLTDSGLEKVSSLFYPPREYFGIR